MLRLNRLLDMYPCANFLGNFLKFYDRSAIKALSASCRLSFFMRASGSLEGPNLHQPARPVLLSQYKQVQVKVHSQHQAMGSICLVACTDSYKTITTSLRGCLVAWTTQIHATTDFPFIYMAYVTGIKTIFLASTNP